MNCNTNYKKDNNKENKNQPNTKKKNLPVKKKAPKKLVRLKPKNKVTKQALSLVKNRNRNCTKMTKNNTEFYMYNYYNEYNTLSIKAFSIIYCYLYNINANHVQGSIRNTQSIRPIVPK